MVFWLLVALVGGRVGNSGWREARSALTYARSVVVRAPFDAGKDVLERGLIARAERA